MADAVSEWLDDFRLGIYADKFAAHGLTSLELLSEANRETLILAGIQHDSQIDPLLKAVAQLKHAAENWRFVTGVQWECRTCHKRVHRRQIHLHVHHADADADAKAEEVDLAAQQLRDVTLQDVSLDRADVDAQIARLRDYIEKLDVLSREDLPPVLEGLIEQGTDSLKRMYLVTVQDLTNVGVGRGAVGLLIGGLHKVGKDAVALASGMEMRDWLAANDLIEYAPDFAEHGFKTRRTILEITEDQLLGFEMKRKHRAHLHDIIRLSKKVK